LFILALVILYFLAAFVVYGGSDYVASRTAFLKVRWAKLRAEERWHEHEKRVYEENSDLGLYKEELKDKVGRMVARFDARKRRIEESVAAGLSEKEAAKKVDEEMAQEEQTATAFMVETMEDEDIQEILEPLYRKAEETGQSEDEAFTAAIEHIYAQA